MTGPPEGTIRRLIDAAGGRKFVLTIVVFGIGTALELFGHLTYEWVALSSSTVGLFIAGNAAVHRGYAGRQAAPADSGAGAGFGGGDL